MPQFFGSPGSPGPPTTVGAAAAAPIVAAHLALVSAPDLRSLDDALAWMAHGLIDHAGFDRAMVLRTRAGRLAMAETAFSQDPELALEARSNAARHPVDLRDDGLELEMIRRRGPALVVPVGDARAWHPITDQLRTRAYVAAPVEAFGRTVATLHADAHFADRAVGPADRTAIGVFAQACRSLVERALLFEELERVRAGVRADAEQLLARVARDPSDVAAAPPSAGVIGPPSPAPHPVLTPRENEVLALMSRGATSREIARHLVLSAGTVKTHARSILRKLGAGTRAEAVALAFGAQPRDEA